MLAALMVLSSRFAFAKEAVEAEAGIKMWYPGWTSEDPTGGSMKLDPTLLVGPAIEVKLLSHLFFEASYLLSTSDFEKIKGTAKLTANRKDLRV